MNNLTVMKKIVVAFTADEWHLYSGMDSTECVNSLNETLSTAVNSGMSRSEVYAAVDKVRDKYAEYGAGDTEPRYKLEDALDVIFGIDLIH